MPLVPVVHEVMLEAFVNVPLAATPLTQLLVQYSADMSVARQVMDFRLVQFSNICR